MPAPKLDVFGEEVDEDLDESDGASRKREVIAGPWARPWAGPLMTFGDPHLLSPPFSPPGAVPLWVSANERSPDRPEPMAMSTDDLLMEAATITMPTVRMGSFHLL